MAFSEFGIGIANLAGFLALFFIIATAVMLFIKKRLFNRYPSYQTLLRNIHIILASLGGAFLLLHADYFIDAPILNTGIFLGYASTAVALVVWFTGFSFLERLKYSLLYHGSLSLFAISLMVVHAIDLGFNISLEISEAILGGIAVVTFTRALMHVNKILSKKSAAGAIIV
jgi:hypothetical protein